MPARRQVFRVAGHTGLPGHRTDSGWDPGGGTGRADRNCSQQEGAAAGAISWCYCSGTSLLFPNPLLQAVISWCHSLLRDPQVFPCLQAVILGSHCSGAPLVFPNPSLQVVISPPAQGPLWFLPSWRTCSDQKGFFSTQSILVPCRMRCSWSLYSWRKWCLCGTINLGTIGSGLLSLGWMGLVIKGNSIGRSNLADVWQAQGGLQGWAQLCLGGSGVPPKPGCSCRSCAQPSLPLLPLQHSLPGAASVFLVHLCLAFILQISCVLGGPAASSCSS